MTRLFRRLLVFSFGVISGYSFVTGIILLGFYIMVYWFWRFRDEYISPKNEIYRTC